MDNEIKGQLTVNFSMIGMPLAIDPATGKAEQTALKAKLIAAISGLNILDSVAGLNIFITAVTEK